VQNRRQQRPTIRQDRPVLLLRKRVLWLLWLLPA
jgi:hypothetical protein